MKAILKTISGFMLVVAIAAGYMMSAGIYNIGATDKHWLITEKLIEWMRNNSIAVRANVLEVPTMEETEYLAIGATHYDAMCTICHLAPGQELTELAQGLYPQAPVFHQRKLPVGTDAIETQTKAYFWVIKNGIKMTAMPAWGLTHDDETIWAMALFVQKLENMSADQYQKLINKHSNSDDHEHKHEHAHSHQKNGYDSHHQNKDID
jgi:mono/diheme cytochrome c family protein